MKKILIIGIPVLILALAAGAYFLGFFSADEALVDGEEDLSSEAARPPHFHKLPPLVVSSTYNGRLRYLQVTLSVLTRDEDTLEQLKLNTPVIQNALIILLGSYDFAALESQEGKEELRKTSESEIVGLFPNEEIESVLFTGFVIQ